MIFFNFKGGIFIIALLFCFCRWFLITPLTVVQREGYSDIEKRVISYKHIMQDKDKTWLFNSLRQQNALKQQNEIRKQTLGKMNLNFT